MNEGWRTFAPGRYYEYGIDEIDISRSDRAYIDGTVITVETAREAINLVTELNELALSTAEKASDEVLLVREQDVLHAEAEVQHERAEEA